MGNNWAEFLIFIAVVAQVFCTIASTTSASRMMFAFSRDRAVPGHQLWRKVSKRDRIPVNTVWAICVLAFLTPLPALWWGYVGYAAATAVAVIGLYIAFVIPIILRLRAGESFERTAWNLGKWYKIVDWIAIVWIFFICIIFMLPAYQGGIPFKSNFLWVDFNYTPLPVFGAFLLFGGWYVLSARKWFKGPVRQGTDGGARARSRPASRRRRLRRPRPRARRSTRVDTAGGLRARPPSACSDRCELVVLRGFPLVLPRRRDDEHAASCAVWQRARATLPMSAVLRPPLPCVATTIRSASTCSAASAMRVATLL